LKRPVVSVVPKGSILWPVLFNIFIKDLDDGTECKFVDDKKSEVKDDTPDGCTTFQKGLDRLENWDNGNLLKFRKGKCKVLSLKKETLNTHMYRLGTDCLESSFAEKTLGV